VSQEENIDTWTEMTKSVCDILSADAKHLQRLKDDRDDWKNRYFKQAERLDRIEHAFRSIEEPVSQFKGSFPVVFAMCLLNLLMIIVLFFVTRGG